MKEREGSSIESEARGSELSETTESEASVTIGLEKHEALGFEEDTNENRESYARNESKEPTLEKYEDVQFSHSEFFSPSTTIELESDASPNLALPALLESESSKPTTTHEELYDGDHLSITKIVFDAEANAALELEEYDTEEDNNMSKNRESYARNEDREPKLKKYERRVQFSHTDFFFPSADMESEIEPSPKSVLPVLLESELPKPTSIHEELYDGEHPSITEIVFDVQTYAALEKEEYDTDEDNNMNKYRESYARNGGREPTLEKYKDMQLSDSELFLPSAAIESELEHSPKTVLPVVLESELLKSTSIHEELYDGDHPLISEIVFDSEENAVLELEEYDTEEDNNMNKYRQLYAMNGGKEAKLKKYERRVQFSHADFFFPSADIESELELDPSPNLALPSALESESSKSTSIHEELYDGEHPSITEIVFDVHAYDALEKEEYDTEEDNNMNKYRESYAMNEDREPKSKKNEDVQFSYPDVLLASAIESELEHSPKSVLPTALESQSHYSSDVPAAVESISEVSSDVPATLESESEHSSNVPMAIDSESSSLVSVGLESELKSDVLVTLESKSRSSLPADLESKLESILPVPTESESESSSDVLAALEGNSNSSKDEEAVIESDLFLDNPDTMQKEESSGSESSKPTSSRREVFDDHPPFISEISFDVAKVSLTDDASLSPTPRCSLFKDDNPNILPISDWIGRLIFRNTRTPGKDDGVWIELEHAPKMYQNLIGKIIPLRWDVEKAEIREYVRSTMIDVTVTEHGKKILERNEFLKPSTRLHSLKDVGPLESLAGSRSEDDVHVILPSGSVIIEQNLLIKDIIRDKKKQPESIMRNKDKPVIDSSLLTPTIYLQDHPIQVSGVYYCVVTIEKRIDLDFFQVRHYNAETKAFDGPSEIIHYPQAKTLLFTEQDSAYPSTNLKIEESPENEHGWYLYGSFVQESSYEKDIFEVEAIEPFRALRLRPNQFVSDYKDGIKFINKGNFKQLKKRIGKTRLALVDPKSKDISGAVSTWKEGDRMIVVHCCGGVKSDTYKLDEKLAFVAGHFAYGYASVIRDRLTKELRFDINYIQIYGTTSLGAVAGAVKRQCFVGDLNRGYLGLRPVSDCLVKLETITDDIEIGSKDILDPLEEFKKQLHIMSARYRVGDGDGIIGTTCHTSCAEDANQSLYVAMDKCEEIIESKSKEVEEEFVSEWKFSETAMHDKTVDQFQKLRDLCKELHSKLAPNGSPRSDWMYNAQDIAGKRIEEVQTCWCSFSRYKRMLPRLAFDVMLKIFLKHDAKLWFITTAAVGGINEGVVPLKPKKLRYFAPK